MMGKCEEQGPRNGHGLYTQIHTRKKAYRLDWGGGPKMELAVRAVRFPRSEDGEYQIVRFFSPNVSGTRPMFYRISLMPEVPMDGSSI